VSAEWGQLAGALGVRLEAKLEGPHRLQLRVTQQPDDELRAHLSRLLAHPDAAEVRSLSMHASYPEHPENDFSWALDAIERLPRLERLFVSGARIISYRGITRGLGQPGRLGSWCRRSSYAGSFPNVHTLDLRDEFLEWPANDWPDLEVLILRPRGNRDVRLAWSHVVLEGAFPKLQEVRFPEHDGDELVEVLLTSPLLAQLRRLDCTDNLTHRGADLLAARSDRLLHLDEIWIGSAEIDDSRRGRLTSLLGQRVRFEPRPGHPDL
jgi:hypothetical protein